jgi:hypothetical protein
MDHVQVLSLAEILGLRQVRQEMTAIPFQFDETSHIYTIERGGAQVEIPGVTRVLDTSGLVDYSAVRPEILERKSKFGKEAHRCTVLYDKSLLDWDSVDPRIIPYVESWVSFRRQTGFIPLLTEEQCIAEVSGMLYGMTIDRQGITGQRGLGKKRGFDTTVEIKTTSQILPHHAIQTAGYALGLPKSGVTTPMARFLSRRRLIVKLNPDGRPEIRECDDRSDMDTFVAALRISGWKRRHQEIYREAA